MTEYRLTHLSGSNPAHYLAAFGLVELSSHDLKLHFDGDTPVVTAPDGVTAQTIARQIAGTIMGIGDPECGELSSWVGTSTAALENYDAFISAEWEARGERSYSRLANFGSTKPSRPSSHFLFFGAGATSLATAMRKAVKPASWKTERFKTSIEVENAIAQDIEEILHGMPAAIMLRENILWYGNSGLDAQSRYGQKTGFVEPALELLAVGALTVINPVPRIQDRQRVLRWALNPRPASKHALRALQLADKHPAELDTFEAVVFTVNKYARFDNSRHLTRSTR